MLKQEQAAQSQKAVEENQSMRMEIKGLTNDYKALYEQMSKHPLCRKP